MQTLCFVILLVLSASSFALTAMVDRTSVAINETVRLEISAPSGDLNAISLDELQQRFNIAGQSSKSYTSIVNGYTERQRSLVLTLIPKAIGDTTIPAFKLGKSSTTPIAITVTEAAKLPTSASDQSVIVDASLDKASAYVGEQVIYTFRLYYRVSLASADITTLEVSDADTIELDDKSYITTFNGSQYNVVEKRLALFFNQSGDITLNPQTLTASIGGARSRFFGSDPFNSGQSVKLSAEPLNIEIKAIPSQADASRWLPASQLTIEQSWSRELDNIPVGEPITHNISITAKGITAERINTNQPNEIPSINVYSEKPEFNNQQWTGGIAGQRKETTVYIPTQPGRFTIPQITINWWNTKKNAMESTVLPAQQITVVGDNLNQQSSGNNPNIAANDLAQPQQIPAPFASDDKRNDLPLNAEANPEIMSVSEGHSLTRWQWLTILGWLIALIATVYAFAMHRRWYHAARAPLPTMASSSIDTSLSSATISEAKSKLISACKDNHREATQRALHSWLSLLKQHLPDYHRHVMPLLSKHIDELQRALYSDETHPQTWQGEALAQVIASLPTPRALAKQQKAHQVHGTALYPE